MKPLITSNFRATTIPKAFILNAISTGLIVLIGVETRIQLDKHTEFEEGFKVLISMVTTLMAALVTYWILHILFNFGGGMLAPKKIV